ncbi:MAG: MerR family transcriptional regulator [Hyphomonadaceae bacterium]|nr:MerR family transcriptional regulator [Hyphomonadaceae bacterium]
MSTALSIGEAARRSGCTVATNRFYEEVGLIPEAERTAGGRRVFTRPGIERLKLVRRLRSMEFGIAAIKELLTAMRGAGTCLDVRDIAETQLQIVRARRAKIDALERTLSGLAGDCTLMCAESPSSECTIIDNLSRTA